MYYVRLYYDYWQHIYYCVPTVAIVYYMFKIYCTHIFSYIFTIVVLFNSSSTRFKSLTFLQRVTFLPQLKMCTAAGLPMQLTFDIHVPILKFCLFLIHSDLGLQFLYLHLFIHFFSYECRDQNHEEDGMVWTRDSDYWGCLYEIQTTKLPHHAMVI